MLSLNADTLYLLRHTRRMSQRELAARIRVRDMTISRWERGVKPIPQRRVADLVAALSEVQGAGDKRAR